MSLLVDPVVGPIVQPVVESIVVRIKKQAGFFFFSTKYVEDMHKDINTLNNLKAGVEDYVRHNDSNSFGVPAQVTAWLNDVKVINAQVESMDIYKAGRCFNFKNRRVVGSIAYKITEDIKKLIDEHSKLVLSKYPIPLGIVNSTVASTSAPPSSDHDEYPTRESTFMSALSALGPDHKSSMVALWGMGGVGKSTMVEKLEKAVKNRGWFQLIVNVAVGENINTTTLQGRIADCVRKPLEETGEKARAEMLRRSFEAHAKDENIKNILVILDNVWESFDLKDIGLDPLPNEGARFKFLLTSRDCNICRVMGVEENSIFHVNHLSNEESKSLFYQLVRDSDEADLDSELQKVGDAIVNQCQGLPIAIKTIALRVKGKQKYVWDNSRMHLERNKRGDFLDNIFELSYKNLKDGEAEAILLLCGVFPKYADIPTEELVRYGWGLKLFENVYTIKEARIRLFTCIDKLTETNFLSASDRAGCVNMHDLVRAFVLGMLSKGEHASIVRHGNVSEWLTDDTSDSWTRISVTSTNGFEFPSGIKFPNLSFLKIMQGDGSFKFPQDFYGGMVELKVIGFERMVDPLLPTSFPCSSNIRVLCLHQCSLISDYSSIGNFKNLEVLSFANSCFEKLPSTIGNLMKLKILDLRGCFDILIDVDILRKLVNLEELYMIPSPGKIVSFTDESCNWLADISKNLTALEIALHGRNSLPKKLPIEKVERFAIYMGHDLYLDAGSRGNTLKLVTCTDDLLESRINELFGKTEMLNLQVNDMSFLEDVMVKSPHISICNSTPQYFYFSNLKVLTVTKCSELEYLFTFSVATTLSKLEFLEISTCNKMETLIHIDNGEERTIIFRKLKVLFLDRLPELSGLCNTVNVIELPQLQELRLDSLPRLASIYSNIKLATSSMLSSISTTLPLFNEQVVIPMLEKLYIKNMKNLKEIWPCQSTGAEEIDVSMLRNIQVQECDNLVNLFPKKPMRLLHRLEELEVRRCSLVQELFNMEVVMVPKLEVLVVSGMENLKAIWPCQYGTNEEANVSLLRVINVEWCINLVNLFPENPMALLHHLEYLRISDCDSLPVLFNIDLDCLGKTEQLCSSLRSIKVSSSRKLREIWSIKGENEVSIIIGGVQIVKIDIDGCENFRTVTSTTTSLYLKPLMDLMVRNNVASLERKKLVKSSQEEKINVNVMFPSYLTPISNHLANIWLKNFDVDVVFEIASPSSQKSVKTQNTQPPLLLLLPSYLKELRLNYMERMSHVWKCNWTEFLILQKQPQECSFLNLTTIVLSSCNNIKYLFSPLMAEFLPNLSHVDIRFCEGMEEVVSSRDDGEMRTSMHTRIPLFPRLSLLNLEGARSLERIGGGATRGASNEISDKYSQVGAVSWSLCQYSRQIRISDCDVLACVVPFYAFSKMHHLQVLQIHCCKSMMEVFQSQGINNNGDGSTTYADERRDSGTSVVLATPRVKEVKVPQLTNLKEVNIYNCDNLQYVFTFSTLESLSQLEKLKIRKCEAMKVIVKDEDGHTTAVSKPVNGPQLTNLKEVDIDNCDNLQYVFTFSTLESLSQLKKLKISKCEAMKVIVKDEDGHTTTASKPVEGPQLTNLKEVDINNCDNLQYVFTFSTLESLSQLEKLNISKCEAMKVIVKDEDGHTTAASKFVFFPRLSSITLDNLPSLEGFFLGKNDFQWPILDDVTIKNCRKMMIFTLGQSTAKKLKFIRTSLGTHSLESGLKVKTKFPDTESTRSQQLPWTFHNLSEMFVTKDDSIRRIVPSIELLHLQKLVNIYVRNCIHLEEVFEVAALEEINDRIGFSESQKTVVELPNLTEVNLEDLSSLKYIWKSNQWTVVKFPYLTRLSIFKCKCLEYVFTSSMVGSLLQLQELHVSHAGAKVIVKEEEECEGKVNEHELQHLKSLKLVSLPYLKGFCFGKDAFSWPSLDSLEIFDTPEIDVFTNGHSDTPKLKVIKTSFGECNVGDDLNSFIKTNQQSFQE